MAQSAVDCCNSALQKLGANSIMSFTDNSLEARQCNIAFDSNRRSELRKHRWNFATKRAVLAPESEAPSFDYLYQFALPADCLRVILPTDTTVDWVVEGKKILTNGGATLYLRYTSDITDVTQWDANFYDLVSIALAMDLCEKITNSPAKLGRLQEDYRMAVAEARRNNAFEQIPSEGPQDSLWLVRL